ncbi:cupin domain-containing protein [Scytonema sp. UIC 10036]|uniref:cupin domain-containing protein n=1 Tax=Scytonema sp. UIC 10036 TaxID=2304196 RepID=UPI0012DA7878|nr:cupin domain-containing protein [Scytonema sp. UIC 10036]MUG91461.1 cupin domain-containing protein [Scytonema sp. UIC 10036]
MVNFKSGFVQQSSSSTYLVLGDFYTFLATGESTSGAYALLEIVMQPQSTVPPHIHDEADEAHYILEGEIEYQQGNQTIVATPGNFLHFSRGQSHGFKNTGSKPAKILMWVTPAGPEQFFAEVGIPVKEITSEEEKPSLFAPPTPTDIEKAIEVATAKYKVKFVL